MRVFVGIEVSDDVRRQAGDVVGALRRRLDTGVDARWVPIENLHLTVRFIGSVADERITALLGALEQPLTTHPFEIELNGCGRFPPRGAPRVLWIGLTRGLPTLTELHQEFDRRVLPFGYAPEDRPFSAHLTLARIKDARGAGDRLIAGGRLIDEALAHLRSHPVVQTVEQVTVFESRLSPKGPHYSPLRRIRLPTP